MYAGTEAVEHGGAILPPGDDHDLGRRMGFTQRAQAAGAGHSRHRQIDQKQVRALGGKHLEGRVEAIGLEEGEIARGIGKAQLVVGQKLP